MSANEVEDDDYYLDLGSASDPDGAESESGTGDGSRVRLARQLIALRVAISAKDKEIQALRSESEVNSVLSAQYDRLYADWLRMTGKLKAANDELKAYEHQNATHHAPSPTPSTRNDNRTDRIEDRTPPAVTQSPRVAPSRGHIAAKLSAMRSSSATSASSDRRTRPTQRRRATKPTSAHKTARKSAQRKTPGSARRPVKARVQTKLSPAVQRARRSRLRKPGTDQPAAKPTADQLLSSMDALLNSARLERVLRADLAEDALVEDAHRSDGMTGSDGMGRSDGLSPSASRQPDRTAQKSSPAPQAVQTLRTPASRLQHPSPLNSSSQTGDSTAPHSTTPSQRSKISRVFTPGAPSRSHVRVSTRSRRSTPQSQSTQPRPTPSPNTLDHTPSRTAEDPSSPVDESLDNVVAYLEGIVEGKSPDSAAVGTSRRPATHSNAAASRSKRTPQRTPSAQKKVVRSHVQPRKHQQPSKTSQPALSTPAPSASAALFAALGSGPARAGMTGDHGNGSVAASPAAADAKEARSSAEGVDCAAVTVLMRHPGICSTCTAFPSAHWSQIITVDPLFRRRFGFPHHGLTGGRLCLLHLRRVLAGMSFRHTTALFLGLSAELFGDSGELVSITGSRSFTSDLVVKKWVPSLLNAKGDPPLLVILVALTHLCCHNDQNQDSENSTAVCERVQAFLCRVLEENSAITWPEVGANGEETKTEQTSKHEDANASRRSSPVNNDEKEGGRWMELRFSAQSDHIAMQVVLTWRRLRDMQVSPATVHYLGYLSVLCTLLQLGKVLNWAAVPLNSGEDGSSSTAVISNTTSAAAHAIASTGNPPSTSSQWRPFFTPYLLISLTRFLCMPWHLHAPLPEHSNRQHDHSTSPYRVSEKLPFSVRVVTALALSRLMGMLRAEEKLWVLLAMPRVLESTGLCYPPVTQMLTSVFAARKQLTHSKAHPSVESSTSEPHLPPGDSALTSAVRSANGWREWLLPELGVCVRHAMAELTRADAPRTVTSATTTATTTTSTTSNVSSTLSGPIGQLSQRMMRVGLSLAVSPLPNAHATRAGPSESNKSNEQSMLLARNGALARWLARYAIPVGHEDVLGAGLQLSGPRLASLRQASVTAVRAWLRAVPQGLYSQADRRLLCASGRLPGAIFNAGPVCHDALVGPGGMLAYSLSQARRCVATQRNPRMWMERLAACAWHGTDAALSARVPSVMKSPGGWAGLSCFSACDGLQWSVDLLGRSDVRGNAARLSCLRLLTLWTLDAIWCFRRVRLFAAQSQTRHDLLRVSLGWMAALCANDLLWSRVHAIVSAREGQGVEASAGVRLVGVAVELAGAVSRGYVELGKSVSPKLLCGSQRAANAKYRQRMEAMWRPPAERNTPTPDSSSSSATQVSTTQRTHGSTGGNALPGWLLEQFMHTPVSHSLKPAAREEKGSPTEIGAVRRPVTFSGRTAGYRISTAKVQALQTRLWQSLSQVREIPSNRVYQEKLNDQADESTSDADTDTDTDSTDSDSATGSHSGADADADTTLFPPQSLLCASIAHCISTRVVTLEALWGAGRALRAFIQMSTDPDRASVWTGWGLAGLCVRARSDLPLTHPALGAGVKGAKVSASSALTQIGAVLAQWTVERGFPLPQNALPAFERKVQADVTQFLDRTVAALQAISEPTDRSFALADMKELDEALNDTADTPSDTHTSTQTKQKLNTTQSRDETHKVTEADRYLGEYAHLYTYYHDMYYVILRMLPAVLCAAASENADAKIDDATRQECAGCAVSEGTGMTAASVLRLVLGRFCCMPRPASRVLANHHDDDEPESLPQTTQSLSAPASSCTALVPVTGAGRGRMRRVGRSGKTSAGGGKVVPKSPMWSDHRQADCRVGRYAVRGAPPDYGHEGGAGSCRTCPSHRPQLPTLALPAPPCWFIGTLRADNEPAEGPVGCVYCGARRRCVTWSESSLPLDTPPILRYHVRFYARYARLHRSLHDAWCLLGGPVDGSDGRGRWRLSRVASLLAGVVLQGVEGKSTGTPTTATPSSQHSASVDHRGCWVAPPALPVSSYGGPYPLAPQGYVPVVDTDGETTTTWSVHPSWKTSVSNTGCGSLPPPSSTSRRPELPARWVTGCQRLAETMRTGGVFLWRAQVLTRWRSHLRSQDLRSGVRASVLQAQATVSVLPKRLGGKTPLSLTYKPSKGASSYDTALVEYDGELVAKLPDSNSTDRSLRGRLYHPMRHIQAHVDRYNRPVVGSARRDAASAEAPVTPAEPEPPRPRVPYSTRVRVAIKRDRTPAARSGPRARGVSLSGLPRSLRKPAVPWKQRTVSVETVPGVHLPNEDGTQSARRHPRRRRPPPASTGTLLNQEDGTGGAGAAWVPLSARRGVPAAEISFEDEEPEGTQRRGSLDMNSRASTYDPPSVMRPNSASQLMFQSAPFDDEDSDSHVHTPPGLEYRPPTSARALTGSSQSADKPSASPPSISLAGESEEAAERTVEEAEAASVAEAAGPTADVEIEDGDWEDNADMSEDVHGGDMVKEKEKEEEDVDVDGLIDGIGQAENSGYEVADSVDGESTTPTASLHSLDNLQSLRDSCDRIIREIDRMQSPDGDVAHLDDDSPDFELPKAVTPPDAHSTDLPVISDGGLEPVINDDLPKLVQPLASNQRSQATPLEACDPPLPSPKMGYAVSPGSLSPFSSDEL